MKIKDDHRLYHDDERPFDFDESPNSDPNNRMEYLIMHYTANNNEKIAIQVLSDPRADNPKARVSAHLVIAPDGKVTQLVPFDRIAWHAGESNWEGQHWINRNSIGIEIVNDGKLKPGGEPMTWVGASGKIYQENEVLLATHFKEFNQVGWAPFTEAQKSAAYQIARVLIGHYELKDILGHEDVHEAKVDPGPAFPMKEIRKDLFGREDPCMKIYKMKNTSKVYQDQGVTPVIRLPPEHKISPLPPKINVAVTEIAGDWAEVKVKGKVKGEKNVTGWVMLSGLDGTGKNRKTRRSLSIYTRQPDPEPPLHPAQKLQKGIEIRRLREDQAMALVAILEPIQRFKFMQGWVPQKNISLVADDIDCRRELVIPDPRKSEGD